MPYVQGDMKDLNRRAVFDLITSEGEISRVDIGKIVGTSGPTVLKITNFFLEHGYVTMAGEEITARGRRPQLLRFMPDSITGIGVDYNGHSAKAALVNYYGEEKASLQMEADGDFDALMQKALPDMLKKLISKSGVPRESVWSVGLCIPGAVDTQNTGVELGPLSGIRFDSSPAELSAQLAAALDLPVYLFNDVNAAAKGEYLLRRMVCDDLVYLSISEGIGAGIILDGKLRTGKHFYTGEIAHIVADPGYLTTIDKPGWLEKEFSAEGLARRFPGWPAGEAAEAARKYIAEILALLVANLCNVLDIQTVVLGGSLVARMGEPLLAEVRLLAGRLCMFDVEITPPSCEQPSLVGTSALALERELDHILSDGTE